MKKTKSVRPPKAVKAVAPAGGILPAERQALERNHMASFIQRCFAELNPGVKLIWAPFLSLIAGHLEQVAHGRLKRLIITVPPRSLKSISVSVALPAFLMGHYPNKEVMNVCYGQDLARKFAEDTFKIMSSPFYIDLFGRILPRKRQPMSYFRTLKGGGRRATSIDGTATGTGANGLIFDDPQKPGETLSGAMRRSTNASYEETFRSRLNDPQNDFIVIVMQRLHEDDFVAHVQGLGDEWTILNLPAIAEQDEEIPYSDVLGDHVFRRKEGRPLHPKRVPLSELEVQRKTHGEAVWATQYQQRPTPAGGGLIKLEWLGRYGPADLPEKFDQVAQSWDTASKLNDWNDYSVCTTWGVKGKHVWLLHVYRERLEYPDLKKNVIRQAQVHDANVVFIEEHSSGIQLVQELKRENFGRVRGIKHTVDKETRMVSQTLMMENGLVHVPAEAPWLDDYLSELMHFPRGKHDDQVDSTSQALEEIYAFKDGRGLYDYYREEAEKARALKEDQYRLRPPPGQNVFYDIEGHEHRLQGDGCYHLTMVQAGQHINAVGWTLEGPL